MSARLVSCCVALVILSLLGCGLSLPTSAAAETQQAGLPVPVNQRPMQEDAELHDVAFVDALHGWAVGDRGVVWHTTDGGRRWRLQDSGVNCRLSSVQFIDPQTGWIAGSMHIPYANVSRGVLLHTRDGGNTWLEDKSHLLPGLARIKFFNQSLGWVAGESSSLFPSGVAVTDNGGRSWTAAGSPSTQGWLAGDFFDPGSGAVAGRSGHVAAVRRRAIDEAQCAPCGSRGIYRLRLSEAGRGWLVGDGGLIRETADGGSTWTAPHGEPQQWVGGDFDWRALEVRSQHVWIAGSPGSRILHSSDGGLHWEAHDTGQSLPLRALTFADEQNGWAVGALGTILVTSDGGRTWQRQRSGGARVALLAVYGEASAAPLELFARLSANEGFLSAAYLVGRRDQEPGLPGCIESPERVRAALVEAGASSAETAWDYPLRQMGLAMSAESIVDGWKVANGDSPLQQLEESVVRQLRMWRPDIIVTHAATLRGEDPLGHVINQIVLRSVEQAADPTKYTEHRTLMGLEAWQAKKIFGGLPPGELGPVNITTAQLAPRLGCSLGEYVTGARGLLESRYAAPPATWGFRTCIDSLPQGLGQHDFLSGIPLQTGGEARRVLIEGPTLGVDLMRRIAQKHRNLQAILGQKTRTDAARFLAQIGDLTGGLDDMAAGNVLFQLAGNYFASGRWDMAAEIYEVLAATYPQHPFAQSAMVWLVQYWASGEAAWREQRAQQTAPAHADRPGSALAAGKRLEQLCPMAFAEPQVRFPLSAADRSQGLAQQAGKYYLDVSRTRPRDAWWSCASGEQWLTAPDNSPAPKRHTIAAAGPRPHLDGRLDDEIWLQARPLELRSALGDDASWRAVALVACDAEFIYFGLDCRRANGCDYPTAGGPRPRDGDLSSRDRVDVFLDIDRDWTTCYRLTIDHRGWTGDDCWGDRTWDPAWYVAASGDERSWTAEAAIPLNELAGQFPAAGQAWGLGVQRTVPGVGFQSWTAPACTSVAPEGFGYLIFEPGSLR